jgi:transporter family protein
VNPIVLAFVAMVAWGMWAVAAELATRSLTPPVATVVSYATSLAVVAGYVVVRYDQPTVTGTGLRWAVAGGFCAGVAGIAFYTALTTGRSAVVTTIGALYFVVTAVVGVGVLGEQLAATDMAGILVARIAVALLAW